MKRLLNLRYLIMGLVMAVLIVQFRSELFRRNSKETDIANTDTTKEYTAIFLPQFQDVVKNTRTQGIPLDSDLQSLYGIT